MNNKKIIIGFNILALSILLSTIVYARPVTDAAFDSIRGGLVQVNNFFAGQQYQPYAKAIDFFFFAFLFIAIYMMGARYAFKEIKRPEQIIVILLGLMTAFLLVLANISVVALLPFIHWLFYVLLFALYWWLLKGIKNGFWRFILALLLTLLTIGLLQGLFNTLSTPTFGSISTPDGPGFSWGGFGFGNFFKDWGGNFKGPSTAGWGDWLSGKKDSLLGSVDTTKITGPITETKTPKETPETPPPKGDEKKAGINWWIWVLLIALLATGGFFAWKYRDSLKKLLTKKPATGAEQELNIQKTLADLKEVMDIKLDVLKKIDGIAQGKRVCTDDFTKNYALIIQTDKAFWDDPGSEAHKQFLAQENDVNKLLNLELKLEEQLTILMKKEAELIGEPVPEPDYRKAHKWLVAIGKFDAEKRKQLLLKISNRKIDSEILFGELSTEVIGSYGTGEDTSRHRQVIGSIIELIRSLIITNNWKINEMATIVRALNSENNKIQMLRETEHPMYYNEKSKYFSYPGDDLQEQIFSKNTDAICKIARIAISKYLVLGADEAKLQKKWKGLISIENIRKVLKHSKGQEKLQKGVKDRKKWDALKNELKGRNEIGIPFVIQGKFDNERGFFYNVLRPAVVMQIKQMYTMARRLQALETIDEAVTVMEDLKVGYTDASGSNAVLTKEEATAHIIPRDKLTRIFTKLSSGKGNFKLACYVSNSETGVKRVRKDDGTFEAIPNSEIVRVNEQTVKKRKGGEAKYNEPAVKEYDFTSVRSQEIEFTNSDFLDKTTYSLEEKRNRKYGDVLTLGLNTISFYLVKKEDEARGTPGLKVPKTSYDIKSITISLGPDSGAAGDIIPPDATPAQRIEVASSHILKAMWRLNNE